MAENIFDRIVVERVDLDITIGPKTYKLSGNNEFINIATLKKTDLFFLFMEIVKKIGFIRAFVLYTKFPGRIKFSVIH